jgi:hypothetical protein
MNNGNSSSSNSNTIPQFSPLMSAMASNPHFASSLKSVNSSFATSLAALVRRTKH